MWHLQKVYFVPDCALKQLYRYDQKTVILQELSAEKFLK